VVLSTDFIFVGIPYSCNGNSNYNHSGSEKFTKNCTNGVKPKIQTLCKGA